MESTSLMMHHRQHEAGDNDNDDDEDDSKPLSLRSQRETDNTAESKEEKAFLRRLDWILITYVWVSYCIKQIDASNYKAAYVSGMKEDLSLYGNELNYFDALFRIGYALSIIPSSLLLATYRPSLLLPSLELLWGVMTALIAVASSPTLIYAARFIIGVCEASAYPGTITILMNWYTPKELSTRVSLFSTSYPAAQILVGSLQAALWQGHRGRSGIAGWRWLFALNGMMTIIVATAGYIIIPDSPADTRAWWLSPRMRELARRRIARAGKAVGPSAGVRWGVIARRLVHGWKLWAFGGAYALWSWAQNANAWFPLYLTSVLRADGEPRFSAAEVNLIPIPAYVLHGVAMVVFSRLSDQRLQRARWVLVQLGVHAAGCVALAVWPGTFRGQMVALHMLFVGGAAGPIVLAWLAEEVKEVSEERTAMVAAMVTLVYAVDCWANLILWPATEAPRYRFGYAFAAVFAVGACCTAVWIRWRLGGCAAWRWVRISWIRLVG